MGTVADTGIAADMADIGVDMVATTADLLRVPAAGTTADMAAAM